MVVSFSAGFSFSSMLLCVSILSERASGTWNRFRAAGVLPNVFVASHLIEGMGFLMFQTFVYLIWILLYAKGLLSLTSLAVAYAIVFLNCLAGLTLGLLVSIIFKSAFESLLFSQSIMFLLYFIGGKVLC